MSAKTLDLASPRDPERRTWLIGAASAGGVAAVATAVPLVSSLAPSDDPRTGSAPTNLEVPPHRFLGGTRLLIGEDAAA